MGKRNKNRNNKNLNLRANLKNAINSRVDFEGSKASGDILTTQTMRLYRKECCKFSDYVKSIDASVRSLEGARRYVEPYLLQKQSEGYSASSIRTYASALAKAYDCKSTDFNIEYEKRNTSDFTRSRDIAERDIHFSEKNNADLIRFQSLVGLRRNELAHLRYDNLNKSSDVYKLELDGRYCKHGKSRVVEITAYNESDKQFVDRFMQSFCRENGKNHIHNAFDCHHYRAVYASNLYDKYARDTEYLDRSDVYYCRNERCGESYDKQALSYVSENLGHNRCEVVVRNYFYTRV